jgi:hypothetical protein
VPAEDEARRTRARRLRYLAGADLPVCGHFLRGQLTDDVMKIKSAEEQTRGSADEGRMVDARIQTVSELVVACRVYLNHESGRKDAENQLRQLSIDGETEFVELVNTSHQKWIVPGGSNTGDRGRQRNAMEFPDTKSEDRRKLSCLIGRGGGNAPGHTRSSASGQVGMGAVPALRRPGAKRALARGLRSDSPHNPVARKVGK